MRLLLAAVLLVGAGSSWAGVLLSRKEALARAFPDATEVRARDMVLTPEEVAGVERAARQRLDSALVTLYEGRRGACRLGRAVFDTRPVRSLSGTFVVVLAPGGTVKRVLVAAFHEPEDYLPSARWLTRLVGRGSGAPLRLGDDLDGLSGATLSARAVADAVRRAQALDALVDTLAAPPPVSAEGDLPPCDSP